MDRIRACRNLWTYCPSEPRAHKARTRLTARHWAVALAFAGTPRDAFEYKLYRPWRAKEHPPCIGRAYTKAIQRYKILYIRIIQTQFRMRAILWRSAYPTRNKIHRQSTIRVTLNVRPRLFPHCENKKVRRTMLTIRPAERHATASSSEEQESFHGPDFQCRDWRTR